MFDHFLSIIVSFFCIKILDVFISKTKLHRWFFLHFLVNMVIVLLSFSDVVSLITNPINISEKSSYWPKNITLTLHLYHILMFRDLKLIDWIHHIVMCSGIFFIYDNPGGEITNFILFFINGLPGGIDYLLLTLVKMNKLHTLYQKMINNYINNWIRVPGILYGATCIYINWHLANIPTNLPVMFFIMFILYGNALYFGNRVAINYGESLRKDHEFFNRDDNIVD
jgi:hypothetical protein